MRSAMHPNRASARYTFCTAQVHCAPHPCTLRVFARLRSAMPTCPQCNKTLRELVRRCPTCQADLDLLVDYVSHLNGGLQRAENLAKAGELGEAVWAYLEVLETDPDNGPARQQVGRVVAAVRKFDLSTPARRVALGLPAQERRGFWKNLPSNEKLLTSA